VSAKCPKCKHILQSTVLYIYIYIYTKYLSMYCLYFFTPCHSSLCVVHRQSRLQVLRKPRPHRHAPPTLIPGLLLRTTPPWPHQSPLPRRHTPPLHPQRNRSRTRGPPETLRVLPPEPLGVLPPEPLRVLPPEPLRVLCGGTRGPIVEPTAKSTVSFVAVDFVCVCPL